MEKVKQIFNYNYFFGIPDDFAFYKLYLFFWLAILIGAFIYRFFFVITYESDNPRRPFGRYLFWQYLIFSLSGLLILFFRTQELQILFSRVYAFSNIFLMFLASVLSFLYYKKKLPVKVKRYMDKKRKEKWLPRAKKG